MAKKILTMLVISAFILTDIGLSYGQPAEVEMPKDAGNRISLDFKGMDVVDVLKLLAQRGNINIAVSSNVRGKVTMFLKDVDIYDAFEMILASNDLAYEKRGDIINVMTEKDYEGLYGEKFNDKRVLETFELKYINANEVSKAITQIKSKIGKVIVDESSNSIVVMDSPLIVAKAKEIILTLDKPVETRIFSLDYAKAEEVKSKLEEKLTKNVGNIQVDERTNKVIVTDLASKLTEIERIVSELDEKTREVLIEAKILEITLKDEFKWGVNWDRLIKMSATVALGANFIPADFTSFVLPAQDGKGTGGGMEIGTLKGHNFHYLMKILETIGRTEILSSPRIVVINNEEASILVGTNQPYATTGTTLGQNISQTTQQVTYVDLGIKLHVTPTINKDGFITMKIKPEVSSKSGEIEIKSEEGETVRTSTVPIISTSEAETTVMVKDGNTIVLAGLIEKKYEDEENKIPYLSGIPLIGNLFKDKKRKGKPGNPQRKELVVFLTPHIISGDAQSPEVKEYLTTPEVGKSEVIRPSKERQRTRFKFMKKTEKIPPVIDEAQARVREVKPARSLSRDDYYRLVREEIFGIVRENYPRSDIMGDVYISFDIAADGSLASEPRIISSADETLEMLAIKSVKEAAPFPPFPESMQASVETFKVLISYK